MLPMENNGSVIIYRRLIKPFVKKHEHTIEEAFKAGEQLAGEVASKGEHQLEWFKKPVGFNEIFPLFLSVFQRLQRVREVAGNIDPLEATLRARNMMQKAEDLMGDKDDQKED